MDINWIGPAIGALIGILSSQFFIWIKGRSGDKVAIRLLSESNQVNVSERVKSNLEIKYKGMPINQLVIYSFQITNEGNTDLNDLQFKIVYKDSTLTAKNYFVIPELDDPLSLSVIEHVESRQEIKINRPYLNRAKAHKDEKLNLSLISSSKSKFVVFGGGPGWSMVYQDFSSRSSRFWDTYLVPVFVFAIIGELAQIFFPSTFAASIVSWLLTLLIVLSGAMALLAFLKGRIR